MKTIEVKFAVGDVAWIMCGNEPMEIVVEFVAVYIDSNGCRTEYSLVDNSLQDYPESELFPTRRELVMSLMGEDD